MADRPGSLGEYRRKRDFRKTAEPAGGEAKPKRGRASGAPAKGLLFVIQKHAASHLHYDFRLEMDGVLKSWAVPKGPSLDPSVKRLAVHVEDHPLSYADFEGTIPAGQYGGGSVIVWDTGVYENIKRDKDGRELTLEESYQRGTLEFRLRGAKLRGGFALVRTRWGGSRGGASASASEGGKSNWLLFKLDDADALPGGEGDILAERPESVLSGRSVEEIGAGDRVWDSDKKHKRRGPMPKPGAVKRGGAAKPAKPAEPPAQPSLFERRAKAGRAASSGVKAGGQTIAVSHPDKMMFPEGGITKLELVEYYARIAKTMLPHLKGRPVSLQQFPGGTDAPGFYQKQAPDYFPEYVRRVAIDLRERGPKKDQGEQDQVVIDNAATLAYLANQNCVTPHPWLSRADPPGKIDFPDQLIWDLDPAGDDFGVVRATALGLRQLLEELGLTSYVKTTGSRGLHVMVPLDRQADFAAARGFASGVAELLAARFPKDLTTEHRLAARKGRLYLDVARNAYAQTAVPAYAVRPRPGASVATPLAWEEVADKKLRSDGWTIRNVFDRLGKAGDPWDGVLRQGQSLKKATAALQGMGT